MRISKKTQKLSAALSDLEIWTKIPKWVHLYHFICTKKIEEKRKKA